MNTKSLPRLIIAGTVVILGLGFLLDGFNAWNFGDVLSTWWPLIIVLIGLASLFNNPSAPLWPLFVVVAGILLVLRENNTIDFEVWNIIWPIGLILIGLSFIFERLQPSHTVHEDSADILVAFSGNDSAVTTDDFKGGNLTALFGGIKLDLRQAKIKDTAKINVFAAFGGAEIIVPKEWRVQTGGLPIFGGWENKAEKPSDKKAPLLDIRGTCLFGGVEVKN
jgi:Domain of unknown function (DUF5668)